MAEIFFVNAHGQNRGLAETWNKVFAIWAFILPSKNEPTAYMP